MNNADVAAVLYEIGQLLELKKESPFRIRAYQNGARALENLTEDVRALSASGHLKDVKGIGGGLAQKVDELLETGHIEYLESLRTEFPPGVRAFMTVPGVGPSTARLIYRELGVDTLEGLREAAEDGRLAQLPGLGEKSVQNVLQALGRAKKRESRISIGKALPVVEELLHQLQDHPLIENLTTAGSLRRWSPTIGDIDLMATSAEPAPVMDVFEQLPQVLTVQARGPTKISVITDNGLQVDLRILEAADFGSLLQHWTGSRQHNIELREYSLKLGLSLSEYGITTVETGSTKHYLDEASFYAALNLPYIEPELREGSGEVQAALAGDLPDLVKLDDIRGDLHMHSTWSDGSASMEDMVLAARERGYEYVAITDHSSGAGMLGGASRDRLMEQMAQARRLDDEIEGIRIFFGSEVDIKRDGTLDFPDEVLEKLDWVIASVHSAFNQPEGEMTSRVVRAIENPHVDALAHPTGRLIGRREPYAIDLEAVFAAAARTGTAIEINSFPDRLDLGDTQARRAKDLGVLLVIDTDAHAPVHVNLIRYGVAMARRGWAEASNILNTRSAAELEGWLKRDAR